MVSNLELSSIKQKSLDFVNLLGNEHDTTSDKIVSLLATKFAVQHAELPPSEGGRDAFLTKLGQRLKLAKGHASVEVKHVVAEVFDDDEAKGGQCWIYSTKNTPFGSTNSVGYSSALTANSEIRADKKNSIARYDYIQQRGQDHSLSRSTRAPSRNVFKLLQMARGTFVWNTDAWLLQSFAEQA